MPIPDKRLAVVGGTHHDLRARGAVHLVEHRNHTGPLVIMLRHENRRPARARLRPTATGKASKVASLQKTASPFHTTH